MCKTKLSFRTKSTALRVAAKHGQTVYECPVCFCFHCTSKTNWRDEFIEIGKYNHVANELKQVRESKNKEIKRLGEAILNLNEIIKRKNEIIKDLQNKV